MMAKLLIKIGDWCITSGTVDFDGGCGVYADHIQGCYSGDSPIGVGDLCWAHDDWHDKGVAVCFYCEQPVPPEIQALVMLQMRL